MADVLEKADANAGASGDPSRVTEVSPGSDKGIEEAKQTVVDGSQMSTPKKPLEAGMDNDQEEQKISGSGDGKEWLDVLGSGQLRKKVLKAGQGEGSRPDRGVAITVSYKGRLQDGTEVEAEDKVTFTQGEGEIVQAIDLCVCLMELGEVAEIHTNARFAYGEYGKEPKVLPNTDMIYEVELLEVNPPPALLTMTLEEICQLANKKREYGNELFGRKDYSGAINSYTRAISLLEDCPSGKDDSYEKEVSEMAIKCFNNLAAAQLKVDAFSAALQSCNSVLSKDPSNVKALFRKGKVLAGQLEFSEAHIYLKKALAIEPSNKTIHQELAKLSVKQQQEVKSEKAMYQRMVGDMATVSEKAESKSSRVKYLLIGLSMVIAAVAIVLALYLS
ncbi:peptidyl-prolyl cis-trans isomerase FKBP8-like [Lytechinus pictus]|uniref:peptidyl-prolyl cis-trans isomerase FKBP8-like n=1 Tax=Lytechinus pictus TaxID=7653 RepID=UPI0030B9C7C9